MYPLLMSPKPMGSWGPCVGRSPSLSPNALLLPGMMQTQGSFVIIG